MPQFFFTAACGETHQSSLRGAGDTIAGARLWRRGTRRGGSRVLSGTSMDSRFRGNDGLMEIQWEPPWRRWGSRGKASSPPWRLVSGLPPVERSLLRWGLPREPNEEQRSELRSTDGRLLRRQLLPPCSRRPDHPGAALSGSAQACATSGDPRRVIRTCPHAVTVARCPGPSRCLGPGTRPGPAWRGARQAYSPSPRLASCSRIWASTAAMAVMLSTRRGVALAVRMWTGLDTPIRIGPMATPSVNTRTRL